MKNGWNEVTVHELNNLASSMGTSGGYRVVDNEMESGKAINHESSDKPLQLSMPITFPTGYCIVHHHPAHHHPRPSPSHTNDYLFVLTTGTGKAT